MLNHFLKISNSEWKMISGIIVAGGLGSSTVDFLTGDLRIEQLPTLPQNISGSSMVTHNGTILLCGGIGNRKKCLQLDHGTWKEHSTLNKDRVLHSTVTTQTATFLFGGQDSETTYEYLPKDSTTWLMGETQIPGVFDDGCAIAVKSDQEIWLIGGGRTKTRNSSRILSFNAGSHTFQELPFHLNVERQGHRCILIPNTTKVMITGGYVTSNCQTCTEILDTQDGNVTIASPMNFKRWHHGMGVITINGEERLAVFGGHDGRTKLDSVELYNTQTEKWETTDFKLSEAKSSFSFLTVKPGECEW